ncbi:MAG: putative metal-dependent TIM-barrel fold hydrolase [Planctomycetota bacterium]|jgi:predicted metal-dependent TIM-barrel fold hydrolase
MRFFDPHIHISSRTTDDLERMATAGVRAVIEPAFWLGQARTSLGSFIDYFSSLTGWERFRCSQFGIKHYCAIGLNSKEANNEGLAREVLEILPRFALKEGVVAIGEIGFDENTKAEEFAYVKQLEFAHANDMVVMVHSPHRDKKAGVLRSLEIAKEIGLPMEKLVIDHNNEETMDDVLEFGAWAAFTLYPNTKMGTERMCDIVEKYGPERLIVDSSADWGVSDPLSVPKTAARMIERGIPEAHVIKTTWSNALEAYSQSGQIDEQELLEKPEIDQRELFGENSILRGQEPRINVGVPN